MNATTPPRPPRDPSRRAPQMELHPDSDALLPWHSPVGDDVHGAEHLLGVDDFMVVAPYNDQVGLLRGVLDASTVTAGVRVGTVDKFQGQEAPVVFFSMTASTAADIPRGIDFLFSKNRFNVAISRARALAYVCLLYTSPSPRDRTRSRMPSSA